MSGMNIYTINDYCSFKVKEVSKKFTNSTSHLVYFCKHIYNVVFSVLRSVQSLLQNHQLTEIYTDKGFQRFSFDYILQVCSDFIKAT